jgi:hypothetical protein
VSKYILILLIALVIFLAYAQNKKWINLANKNKPSTGSVLGIFDELFSPSKHQANIILQEQKELRVDASSSNPNIIEIELPKK